MSAPPGPKSWMEAFARMEERITRITPISGDGTSVDDSPTGKGRSVNMRGNSFPSSTPRNDFSLYDASTTSGGATTNKLGITNGMVNGMLPSGMTAGGAPAYFATVSGSGQAYVVVTVDDDEDSSTYGNVTSVTIGTGASVPDNTSDTGYCGLGDYAVTDDHKVSIGAGRQGIGSQAYGYCGGSHYFDPA